MTTRRTVIFTAAICSATLLIALSSGEIYLRLNGLTPYVRTVPGQYQNRADAVSWAQTDPYFGWTAVKNSTETNSQGFRDSKEFSVVDTDRAIGRVMILGDSFVYGAGSSPDETVPHLLQVQLNGKYEVFNVGVPGWGIDQMYLAYTRYKDTIKPHIVILAFIDDDVSRVLEAYRVNEGMTKPSFRVYGGELVMRTASDGYSVAMNTMMNSSVFLSLVIREALLALDARPVVYTMFKKIEQEAQRRNEAFVVLRIPCKEQAGLVGRSVWYLKGWQSVVHELGTEYLDPLEDMRQIPNWNREFYIEDGHLSPAGNRYLARYLYQNVFENKGRIGERRTTGSARD